MRIVLSTLVLGLSCAAAMTAGCSSDARQTAGTGGAGSGGGGGGGTAGGGGSTINCDAIADPVDPSALVDDMESPDYLAPVVAGRNGSWWSGGDMESASVANNAAIQPSGDAAAEAIPGGRCGSMYAMRITGHGFTLWTVLSVSMGWGSVDGGSAGVLPYDASGWQGITFWARVGDTSTNQVRFAVSDKYTRPEGGFCVDGGSLDVACYDLFGVDLSQLSTTWKAYRIPFSSLTQRHFGLQRPALDASSIYTIEFSPAPNTIFDFWVDDVSFY